MPEKYQRVSVALVNICGLAAPTGRPAQQRAMAPAQKVARLAPGVRARAAAAAREGGGGGVSGYQVRSPYVAHFCTCATAGWRRPCSARRQPSTLPPALHPTAYSIQYPPPRHPHTVYGHPLCCGGRQGWRYRRGHAATSWRANPAAASLAAGRARALVLGMCRTIVLESIVLESLRCGGGQGWPRRRFLGQLDVRSSWACAELECLASSLKNGHPSTFAGEAMSDSTLN
jgi:hypothetical protein